VANPGAFELVAADIERDALAHIGEADAELPRRR